MFRFAIGHAQKVELRGGVKASQKQKLKSSKNLKRIGADFLDGGIRLLFDFLSR